MANTSTTTEKNYSSNLSYTPSKFTPIGLTKQIAQKYPHYKSEGGSVPPPPEPTQPTSLPIIDTTISKQVSEPPVDPLKGYVPQYSEGRLVGFYKGSTFIPREAAITSSGYYNPSAVSQSSSVRTAEGVIITRYDTPMGRMQQIEHPNIGDINYTVQPKFEGAGPSYYYPTQTRFASYENPEVLANARQPQQEQQVVYDQSGTPYSTVSRAPSTFARVIRGDYLNAYNPMNVIERFKRQEKPIEQKTLMPSSIEGLDVTRLYAYAPAKYPSGTMKAIPAMAEPPSNFNKIFIGLGEVLNPINLATQDKYLRVVTEPLVFKPLEKIGITEVSIGRQAALQIFGGTSPLGPAFGNELFDTRLRELRSSASFDIPKYQKVVSGFASEQYRMLRETPSYPIKAYGAGLLVGGAFGALSRIIPKTSIAEFAAQVSKEPMYLVKFGSRNYGDVMVGAKNVFTAGKVGVKYGFGAAVFGTDGYNIATAQSPEEFGRRLAYTSNEFILFGLGAKEGVKIGTPYKETISKAKVLPSEAMEKQIVKTSETIPVTLETGETINIKVETPKTIEGQFKRTTQIIPEQYRITTPFDKFFGEPPIKEVLGTAPKTVSVGKSLGYTKLGDPYILLESTAKTDVVKFVSGTGQPVDFKTFYQQATPVQKRLFRELAGSNTEKILSKMFREAEEGTLGEVRSQLIIRNGKLAKQGRTTEIAESLTRTEQLTPKAMERFGFTEDNIVGFEMYKSQTTFKRTTKPFSRSTGNIDKLNTIIVRKLPIKEDNLFETFKDNNIADVTKSADNKLNTVLKQEPLKELPKTPPPKIKAPSYRLKAEPDKYIFPQSKYAGLGQYERQELTYVNRISPKAISISRNIQINKPIQIPKINVRGMEVLKPMNKEISKELNKELSKELSKELNKEIIKEMGKEMQKQMQKEMQKQMEKQMQKQFSRGNPFNPKQPPTPPPRIPKIYLRPSSKSIGIPKQAYSVLQKRRGVFIPIAKGLPKGLALKLGSERTLRDLSRTFKLAKSGTTEMEDIDFIPQFTQFRQYKVRKGRTIPTDTYIQKQKSLLQTPEEKYLIQQAKRIESFKY